MVCAWGVHAYTALGSVLGLLALVYAAQGDYRASFLAMTAATMIDASDGTLARAFDVKQRIPIFDGAMLDNVIDYLTYVAAPVFLMLRAGLLLPGGLGLAIGSAVMLASAYGFCRTDAKTSDHFFTGFPSYWNLTALYLFCFGLSPLLNSLIVIGLAAMVFVPIKYIYPNRTQNFRPLTLALGFVWAAAAIELVWNLPHPHRALVWGSFAYIIYYLAASFFLQGRALVMRARAAN